MVVFLMSVTHRQVMMCQKLEKDTHKKISFHSRHMFIGFMGPFYATTPWIYLSYVVNSPRFPVKIFHPLREAPQETLWRLESQAYASEAMERHQPSAWPWQGDAVPVDRQCLAPGAPAELKWLQGDCWRHLQQNTMGMMVDMGIYGDFMERFLYMIYVVFKHLTISKTTIVTEKNRRAL